MPVTGTNRLQALLDKRGQLSCGIMNAKYSGGEWVSITPRITPHALCCSPSDTNHMASLPELAVSPGVSPALSLQLHSHTPTALGDHPPIPQQYPTLSPLPFWDCYLFYDPIGKKKRDFPHMLHVSLRILEPDLGVPALRAFATWSTSASVNTGGEAGRPAQSSLLKLFNPTVLRATPAPKLPRVNPIAPAGYLPLLLSHNKKARWFPASILQQNHAYRDAPFVVFLNLLLMGVYGDFYSFPKSLQTLISVT